MQQAQQLADIISAVPDIGDKSAREITIARMAFAAGRASAQPSLAAIRAALAAAVECSVFERDIEPVLAALERGET